MLVLHVHVQSLYIISKFFTNPFFLLVHVHVLVSKIVFSPAARMGLNSPSKRLVLETVSIASSVSWMASLDSVVHSKPLLLGQRGTLTFYSKMKIGVTIFQLCFFNFWLPLSRIRVGAFKKFFDENPDSLIRIVQVDNGKKIIVYTQFSSCFFFFFFFLYLCRL